MEGARGTPAGREPASEAAAQPRLEIVRPDDLSGVVVVRGELDQAGGDDVAAAIRDVLAAGVASVVVDTRGVRAVDEAGVAALVVARAMARRAGAELSLRAPSRPVVQALERASVIHVFVYE